MSQFLFADASTGTSPVWVTAALWITAVTVLTLALTVAVLILLHEPPGMHRWVRTRRHARRDAHWLVRALTGVESINEFVGRLLAWAVLTMVLLQFLLVVMRYVFSLGSIPLQESVWYLHGLLFTLGAGYTLLHNGHVRLDVLHARLTRRTRAWIDLCGVLFALLPLCLVILVYGQGYVNTAWAVREGSSEVSGLQWIWLLKTAIPVFAILLLVQGIAIVLRSLICLWRIWPGREQTGDGN